MRSWTPRHYLPSFAGIVLASVYVICVRLLFSLTGHGEPPIWMVSIIGQAVFWAGVVSGKLFWFGWK